MSVTLATTKVRSGRVVRRGGGLGGRGHHRSPIIATVVVAVVLITATRVVVAVMIEAEGQIRCCAVVIGKAIAIVGGRSRGGDHFSSWRLGPGQCQSLCLQRGRRREEGVSDVNKKLDMTQKMLFIETRAIKINLV